jgi:hypothetical protein
MPLEHNSVCPVCYEIYIYTHTHIHTYIHIRLSPNLIKSKGNIRGKQKYLYNIHLVCVPVNKFKMYKVKDRRDVKIILKRISVDMLRGSEGWNALSQNRVQ